MQQNRPKFISSHEDLEVYQIAFDAAMEIFELTKKFPQEEKYSLIDQLDVLLVQFVLILPKHGGEDPIKVLFCLNLMMPKPKQQKPKSG